jgi:hypothetical protein
MESLYLLAAVIEPGGPLVSNCLVLFYALVIGHAMGDFPFQTQFIAVGKDPHANLSSVTGGKEWPAGMWVFCLSVHSLIHAGVVWYITDSIILSFVELVLHWIIDFAKNEKWTTFYLDQALHVLCKALYVYPYATGIIP